MEMSTCDEPRPPNGPSPIATASGQSEYGFAEKVVEGMSLSINSIVIRISAKAFNASFELSQLQVYSVNTSWSISDLRFTRIQDPQRGEDVTSLVVSHRTNTPRLVQILTFKEISWQMIRIEADAIQSAEHEMLSAPIRLITNQSKIRVTLKRRIKDCNVVASKLILILDDLLWVLTDSQLKAMVQYAKSLSEAMEKSAQQRKSMATEDQVSSAPPSAQQVRTQQASTAADQSATMARLFSAYDVCETSHHLQITHLDLHICDDIHAKDKVINKRITGGAMQLSFSTITLDYYPFHRAGDSCAHWMHYSEATKTREGWARNLLDEFKSNVEMLKTAVRDQQGPAPANTSPQHGRINTSSSASFSPPPTQSPKTQLMSSSVVLRMADFSIYQVSTADQRRSSPKAMISCNKKSLYLPPEMPAIHVEFTEYYFPDGKDYPIPCPNLYGQLNALQLVLDPRSLVWINLFALDLRQSLEQFMEIYKLSDSQKPDEHVDIKVDGLMLKVSATLTNKTPGSTTSTGAWWCRRWAQTHSRCRPPLTFGRCTLPSSGWTTKGPVAAKGRPQPFVDSFPLTIWACQPAKIVQHQERLRCAAGSGLTRSTSGEAVARLQRKRLLKEYYSTDNSNDASPPPSNGLHKPLSLDSLPSSSSSSLSLSKDAGEPPAVRVPDASPAQHQSAAADTTAGPGGDGIQERPQGPLSTLRRRPPAFHRLPGPPAEERRGVAAPEAGPPAGGFEISSGVRALAIREQRNSGARERLPEKGSEGGGSGSEGGAAKGTCTVDQLLCGEGTEVGTTHGPAPLVPTSSSTHLNHKTSQEERTSAKNSGKWSSDEGGEPVVDGLAGVEEMGAGLDSKAQMSDPLSDPLGSKGWSDKDPTAAKMPQSISSGRLMRDRSQSSFSVSYKNMKKSPSLQSAGQHLHRQLPDGGRRRVQSAGERCSVGTIVRRHLKYLKHDCSGRKLYRPEGFKDSMSEQSATESAAEAVTGQEQEGGVSPDTVSATSQSTDDPTKDIVRRRNKTEEYYGDLERRHTFIWLFMHLSLLQVSVLVLKVRSVCVGMEAVGESTAVALEVGQVTPSQLGNVSLRQYLSNRSLAGGDISSASARSAHSPEVCARLESGPCAAAHSPLAERNGFLQLRLHGYQASFLMSTMRNLAHFLEDDSAPQVLPMEISVRDTHIHMKDDGPRDNPADPESSPITLHVDSLIIHRRDDGSFSIGVDAAAETKPRTEGALSDGALTPVPEVAGSVCSAAKATQTQALPTGPHPSAREKMLTEENECLKVELSRAKMALAEAQMEKDSLLHRMKTLKVNTS
ncbi:UHRF1-binding protein 1-like [Collichthys lucidus]|uniref:UHRF1-binding protein 1-like n=1 Tax=Collichthys lucidus TaxID=240159 RepID=A0A4U5VQG0_COLLU|nr:UHRF1-binding protein 1-like [Collichthys lucidus]